MPSRGRDQHDKQATLHGPHHVAKSKHVDLESSTTNALGRLSEGEYVQRASTLSFNSTSARYMYQGEGQGEGEGCTRSIRWRVTRRGGRRAVAPLGGTLLLARQQAGALFGHISTWAPTDVFSIQGHEKPFCDAEVGSGFIGSGLGLGLGLGLGFGVRVRGPNLRDDPADESGH